MPLGEVMTGTRSRCASAVSSSPASDRVTPWPMKITGARRRKQNDARPPRRVARRRCAGC